MGGENDSRKELYIITKTRCRRRVDNNSVLIERTGALLWRSVPSAFPRSVLELSIRPWWNRWGEGLIFEIPVEQLLDSGRVDVRSLSAKSHPDTILTASLNLIKQPPYRQLGHRAAMADAPGGLIVKMVQSSGLPTILPSQKWVIELSTHLLSDRYVDQHSSADPSANTNAKESSGPVASYFLGRELMLPLPTALHHSTFRRIRKSRRVSHRLVFQKPLIPLLFQNRRAMTS